MFSIPAKSLLRAAALAFLLLSCSKDEPEPPWEPGSHLGSKEYPGGIFPIWIKLKGPEKDLSSISWRTGYSRIAYRRQALNSKGQITADTAFFYWEEPPPVTVKIDSVKSGGEWQQTRTELYIDTIYAIVDGLKSSPIIIEIKNILPRISSISVGGLAQRMQPGDSVLTIAAHPGDNLDIELRIGKAFNKDNSPKVYMPDIFGSDMRLKQESDTLYSWEWTVPRETIDDSSSYLRIMDSGSDGGGDGGKIERLYKVHLISYNDFGSVWAASENEIVKYSPNGSRVLRISDPSFSFISDIAVNSNNGRLFAIDQYKSIFAVYNTYGKLLYKDSTLLRNPISVAVDIEGVYIWVADGRVADGAADISRLRAFDFIDGRIGTTALGFENLSGGLIRGLSPDQYERNGLWFAVPERDTIGRVSYSRGMESGVEYIIPSSKWNRPSMVSHDNVNGLAWVADSSRIVAIDKDGNEKAIVSGFKFVSAVSASKGSVWASDIYAGKVYRFDGPFSGSNKDLSMTAEGNGAVIDGFLQPAFVSAFIVDGSAWVMDKGTGLAVLLDRDGKRKASGAGLIPSIGKTIQKVE